jgi:predicted phosphodiesterase
MHKEIIQARQEVICQALKDFPKISKHGIAKVLFARHPELFETQEMARSTVRYYAGAKGEMLRKKKRTIKIQLVQKTANAYEGFPEGETCFKDGWYPINFGESKTLILSDIHAPYHNKEALIAALKYGQKEGCTDVLINGDLIDCHSLSDFCRDPRKKSFAQELIVVKDIMKRIRDLFSGDIAFKLGNHEERYERFMYRAAPQLLDLDAFEMENLLEAEDIGFKVIKDKRRIKIGKLWVIHGHELPRGMTDPVNPARGLYLKAKTTAICGHWHRTSEHTETSMDDDMITCWSTGCLCDLRPEYAPINKWNHGFATVTVIDKQGNFEVDNHRIYNGKVL